MTSPEWTTLDMSAMNDPSAPVSTLSPRPPSVSPSVSSQPVVLTEAPDLQSTALYLNRELCWLEFNARVLAEADNDQVPLLERLKFSAIVSSNLDEFFMVRVAGLKQQLTGEVGEIPPDGLTVNEQLNAISARVHQLQAQQMASLELQLLPKLAEQGVVLVTPEALPPEALAALDERFHSEVFPILTPIAIDPGHPFPHLRNRSLNLGVMFMREGELETGFGVVQVPMMLPRLMEVSGVKTRSGQLAKHAFVLLEQCIARHVGAIFPGVRLKGVYSFRVTRNFDLEIDEEDPAGAPAARARERRAPRGGRGAHARVAREAREGAQARPRPRRVPDERHRAPQRDRPHEARRSRRAPRPA
jgi:polyphosphate kinase